MPCLCLFVFFFDAVAAVVVRRSVAFRFAAVVASVAAAAVCRRRCLSPPLSSPPSRALFVVAVAVAVRRCRCPRPSLPLRLSPPSSAVSPLVAAVRRRSVLRCRRVGCCVASPRRRVAVARRAAVAGSCGGLVWLARPLAAPSSSSSLPLPLGVLGRPSLLRPYFIGPFSGHIF